MDNPFDFLQVKYEEVPVMCQLFFPQDVVSVCDGRE
jgi:hypothetical protein